MSIAKLFVKVFGENIFDKTSSHASAANPDFPACPLLPDLTECVPLQQESNDMTLPQQLTLVKNWLETKLGEIDTECAEAIAVQEEQMKSRIGGDHVMFDVDFTSTMRASSDKLSLRSQGSFNTVKSNVCVFGGKWMYEVQLHSKSVMQIGWCSNKCSYDDNSGVGDTKYSYGFDGSKQQLWHISTRKYGEKWQIGDVIGATIDIENEEIEFYRNGRPLGMAFNKIEKGPGITFYGAVSLGYNQSIEANFGNMPFRYPVEGFLPLQARPIKSIRKATLLISYLLNIAQIASRHGVSKDAKNKDFSTKKTVYVLFCTIIFDKLSKILFDNCVIEEALLFHIKNLTSGGLGGEKETYNVHGNPGSVLDSFLSMFWNYLEFEEVKYLFKKMVNSLLRTYSHTHIGLDYESQIECINLLTALCNHEKTRKFLIDMKLFKKHCLALFLYVKPPEFIFMEELIPNHLAWTEGIGGPKNKYLAAAEKINKSVEPLHQLQKHLLTVLLNNNDASSNSPSSRKLFISRYRRYVMELSTELRPFHTFFLLHSNIQQPLESTVALSFICTFTDCIRTLFEKELPGKNPEVSSKYFFDGSLEYQQFDRLGGVLSHLRKVHRNDIVQQLGQERTHEVLDEERSNGIQVQATEIDTDVILLVESLNDVAIVGRTQGTSTNTFTHFMNPRMIPTTEVSPGVINQELSLNELLDIGILFYYCSGHKYIVKIASVRDEISGLNEVLNETKYYREEINRKIAILENHSQVCLSENHMCVVTDIKTKFSQRENVFAKRSIDLARKQAWFRGVALNNHRRSTLIWLLERTLYTLTSSSKLGNLFTFVPEVYVNVLPILLDTAMDLSYHDLHGQYEMGDVDCAVNMAADFLSYHSADPRIILASCKDSMLQALGTLTCHKAGIRALEKAPKNSQNALIKALLRPYENRAWGQSNWLLLRFWLGDGFAYRDSRVPSVWQGGNTPIQIGLIRSRARNESHTGLLHNVAPPTPSKHFQKLIGAKLIEDEPFATVFLNSVLAQLNWAFSEFILLLQEIQNTANRHQNTVFEAKQLKICSMCFELTVSLMRCLEMIITVAPEIFQDASRPNSDLLLNRVLQLISQVLSRVTVPPGCFQFVVDMCSADLNAVTHFQVITSALGILLALMRPEIQSDKSPQKVTRVTRAFLTDPSFQFATLDFALGEVNAHILQQIEIPRGNFDPQQRAHIDPLTNDVRVPIPSTSKKIRADPPVIKFNLADYPTHVTTAEIDEVRALIEMLRMKQALLSEITLPSEDSLCPICYAKPTNVVFLPCRHQSCTNCILQHLINSKLCFFCKTLIKSIENVSDGAVIYRHSESTETSLFDAL